MLHRLSSNVKNTSSNVRNSNNPAGWDWEDEEAARKLVERFRPRLLTEIQRQLGTYLQRRFDAEDVLQSAFCSFFRRARNDEYQFDHSHALFQLLLTIAENKIRRSAAYHTRLCRDIRREAGTTATELDPSDGNWDRELEKIGWMVERIADIVDTLPKRDAEFFRRRFVEGHAIGKISAETGWSVTTVKRVLHHVRQRICLRFDSFP